MMETESMKMATSIETMQKWQLDTKANDCTIGFVPTMGSLHDGHLALIEEATALYDYVVVSIFVNPTQFGPTEDFDAYPRNLEVDMQLAKSAGADFFFCPTKEEMYPEDSGIRIVPGPLANRLCGASRPGHFDGVLQVVLKLMNIVQPNGVFFGTKDAQQLAIIESFIKGYNYPIKVFRVETVRESDGLAKSSRNVNLSDLERQEAPVIYETLKQGEVLIQEGVSSDAIESFIAETLTKKTSGEIDYVSLLTYPQLEEVTEESKEIILACAIQFSKTRLIDNIIFKREG